MAQLVVEVDGVVTAGGRDTRNLSTDVTQSTSFVGETVNIRMDVELPDEALIDPLNAFMYFRYYSTAGYDLSLRIGTNQYDLNGAIEGYVGRTFTDGRAIDPTIAFSIADFDRPGTDFATNLTSLDDNGRLSFRANFDTTDMLPDRTEAVEVISVPGGFVNSNGSFDLSLLDRSPQLGVLVTSVRFDVGFDISRVRIFFESTRSELFTPGDDIVNFNLLDPDDHSGANSDALAGNDMVVLPDGAGGLTAWSLALFHGGDGNDSISAGVIDPDETGAYIPIFGDAGDDLIIGSAGADTINGGAGNDTLAGGGGVDRINGIDGDDRFLISDADIAASTPGEDDMDAVGTIIDGSVGQDVADFSALVLDSTFRLADGESDVGPGLNLLAVERIVGGTAVETLTVQGGTLQNRIRVEFDKDDLSFASTSAVLTHGTALGDMTVTLEGIDRIIFEGGINNVVDLSESFGSVALEMLRLADEAYGPEAGFHEAEALAYETEDQGYRRPTSEGISDLAVNNRHWHAVSAIELGIRPADDDEGDVRYSFVNGVYQAEASGSFTNNSQADAMLLSGLIGGQQTLAVIFRGTDQLADVLDYDDFRSHYAKYQPLIAGIQDYLTETPGVTQVLISGHSLGGAMAQLLTNDLGDWDAVSGHALRTFTIGSAGAEETGAGGSILNFSNTDDVVPIFSENATNPVILGPLTTAALGPFAGLLALSTIASKTVEGHRIMIDSDVSTRPSTDEHDSGLYISELLKLIRFAQDNDSRFSQTPLADSLRSNQLYAGSDIRIALGAPVTLEGTDSRDNYSLRYTTAFNLEMRAFSGDHFVLGNYGASDRIVVRAGDMLASGGSRIFDGATGNDTLALMGPRGGFTVGAAGSDGGTAISLGSSLVGTAYRIETIEFRDAVVALDGRTLVVSRPLSTTETFRINAGADYADAEDGDFNVEGSSGSDLIYLGLGSRFVDGGAGDDHILVKEGQDSDVVIIDGGSGADMMIGGRGTNIYVVDDIGDQVIEDADSGTDTVLVTLSSYSLGANLERLSFQGDGDKAGTGNGLDNFITAGGGNDTLDGGGGDDQLNGAAGHNYLSGGSGGDRIMAGGGNDHIFGSTTDVMAADGGDVIESGAGRDRIFGGSGDDTISGGGSDDTVNGNRGADSIAGGDGDDLLRGGRDDDRMLGDAGADTLSGDLGADILTGGLGADLFRFDDGASLLASPDRITDFEVGLDKFSLGFTALALLTGGAQPDAAAAAAIAQQIADGRTGDGEVILIAVGDDSYLFYAGNGGATINSLIVLEDFAPGGLGIGAFV